MPMRPGHSLSLRHLFPSDQEAIQDVIDSLMGHIMNIPKRAGRLKLLGLSPEDVMGFRGIAERIVQHAMAEGTLSYIETGNPLSEVKDLGGKEWEKAAAEVRRRGDPEPVHRFAMQPISAPYNIP